jgi:hypothetical protein
MPLGLKKNSVSRVVQAPVTVSDTAFGLHAGMQRRTRIRREDVESRGGDALTHGPFDGALENTGVVVVHAEDEAAVDHHAEVAQPLDRSAVVTMQVLLLVGLRQVRGR